MLYICCVCIYMYTYMRMYIYMHVCAVMCVYIYIATVPLWHEVEPSDHCNGFVALDWIHFSDHPLVAATCLHCPLAF